VATTTGGFDLQYTASATVAQGTGSDVHTVSSLALYFAIRVGFDIGSHSEFCGFCLNSLYIYI